MLGLVTLWSHLLAAALYGALAIFQLRHWNGDARNRPLVTAFATVSVWAIFLGLLDGYDMLPQLAESARNLAFLAFMYGIVLSGGKSASQRAVRSVYAAVAAVIGLQIVIGGVIPEFRGHVLVFETLVSTSQIIGLTIAAGALILVHNLYGQAAPASRHALRFPMIALAAMWAYDLHLYTVAYFARGSADELFAMRGAVLAMLVPLFALGIRGASVWKVQISRAATFQSLSVIAILAYLIVMMSTARAMEIVGGAWGRAAQFGILFAMTAAAVVLLPSPRSRAWLKVAVAKHLFEHRYDYRQEWLRFTDTVGRRSDSVASLEERVVKALADIGESPGGLLLTADSHYRFSLAARWNSAAEVPPSGAGADACNEFAAVHFHVSGRHFRQPGGEGDYRQPEDFPGTAAQFKEVRRGVLAGAEARTVTSARGSPLTSRTAAKRTSAPMASSTWDRETLPEEHAEPEDTAIPARSKAISAVAASRPGSAKHVVLPSRGRGVGASPPVSTVTVFHSPSLAGPSAQ